MEGEIEDKKADREEEMGAPAKSQPKESKRQLPEKGPKPKKTKFEKSIETICTSFAQCSEDEMKR